MREEFTMKIFILLMVQLLLVGSLFAAEMKKGAQMPAIVPTSWLKNEMLNPNLVIIDLRTADAYKAGHLKHAVNIPALKGLFDSKFFMPKLDYLQKTFSNAGIDSNSLVVAYDNGDFIWAARFYWILEVLGHKNVGILKVGYGNPKLADVPFSTQAYLPKPTEFVPRVDSSKVQTKLSTLMAIDHKTIIDGRKVEAYEGKESTAKRFGHIPTAKNYACTQNYQVTKNGNEMRDLKELKSLYKDLDKSKEIVLYCDGGAEAALNYIVLQELGFKASVYDGSWLEWGNDANTPVENPSDKK